MMIRKITGLLVLVSIFNAALAQQKASVAILSKPKADGIWLRWAPSDPANWQLGNRYGYTIERFTLLPNGDMVPGSQMTITQSPLKPLTETEFDKIAETSDEAAVLQEILYGKDFNKNFSANDLGSVLSQKNELENRYGIALLMCDLSIDAAKAGALFFKDASAQKGSRYIYRIKIATETVKLEPGVVMVNATAEKPMQELKDLKAQFGNKKVALSWSTLMHKGVYSAYYIERSTDGKTFKKLTDLPYVHMSEKIETETAFYVDSLDINQKTYYYRINGISPFAEIGPYSNIVSGEGKDDLTGLLIIREGKVLEQRKVKVAWEFPQTIEKQIAGFYVSSAPKHDGPYTDLNKKPLAKTIREYTQETPYNNTYYTLRAVDKNGVEVARSFPYLVQIADETPPAIPVGLTGSMDKTGIASLTWTANTDKDLLGYRVFRSNSLKEEFVEVTKVILSKPSFVDTVNIKVLNKKIYYSIVAVDKNYNPSEYTTPLLLMRPDIIAPAAPVLTRTEVVKDTIALAWINSASDDVAKYEITKIEKDEKLSRVMLTWYPSAPLTTYKDISITPGKTYQYIITAYDSSGNKSLTKSREVYFEPGFRKAVTGIEDSVDRQNKEIILQWKNDQPAVKCIIYRKVNDGPIKILATLDGNVESFVDRMISPNNTYIYKIQPIYSKGVRAMISGEIKITY
jgi:fibronectin type 3 domain-containing protein